MHLEDVFAPTLFARQTVFITGGGSGINLGVAECFARLGANIAICGRTQSKLDDAAGGLQKLGANVVAQAADVRDMDALADAMATTEKQLGPINVLVAGAAGNFTAPTEKLSSNGFRTVVDIDLVGAFNAARAAFEQLRQTRGSLIFISAGQAQAPFEFQAHAGAAKAGVDNLMKTLALEWGPYGIRANSVLPGWIADTEGLKRLAPPGSEHRIADEVPMRRMGDTADVGALACFLASPLASYITGNVVAADGGMMLRGSGIWTQVIGAMLAETGAN
ncbi:SDR family oxidoreductase [Salinisphaera sp. P385]|uniref:SDR family oxidoreductase n=1 Tax=Spectribacter acetivorans TaxID=3075603 RepID=A0ABU3B4Q3_9GAMM|nr:SDR family oxidoreductase [Salinisphaera sp. P385]MDT0617437.1 SDR family oxidoreductase [Salinisphaera sp. P385]